MTDNTLFFGGKSHTKGGMVNKAVLTVVLFCIVPRKNTKNLMGKEEGAVKSSFINEPFSG